MPEAGRAEIATVATVATAATTASLCLAFDFGLKRIGVAHGNRLLQQGQPLTVINVPDNAARFAAIEKLLKQWQPEALVVGLPLHPDGAEHDMTRRARRFANQLHGRFGLPVWLVDERYSSAVLHGKRGQVIDADSAALILQQFWLDPAHAIAAGPTGRPVVESVTESAIDALSTSSPAFSPVSDLSASSRSASCSVLPIESIPESALCTTHN